LAGKGEHRVVEGMFRYIASAIAVGTVIGLNPVPPSLQYAQNSTHVIAEVKFSKKSSAPARTAFKVKDVGISCEAEEDSCKLDLTAFDTANDTPNGGGIPKFFFKISHEFAHEVVVEDSYYREGSAGRYIIFLKKSKDGIRWDDFFKKGSYIGSVKLWIDMSREMYFR